MKGGAHPSPLAALAFPDSKRVPIGWSVVLGFTAVLDSIPVFIGSSPRNRQKEERKDGGK